MMYSQDSINTTSTRPYLPALRCGVQTSSTYLYVCVILKADLWCALPLVHIQSRQYQHYLYQALFACAVLWCTVF